jgi:putative tricarboxylic transport membrane protein
MRGLDRFSSLFWLVLSVIVCLHAHTLGLGHFRNPGPGFLFFWSGIVLGILSLILFSRTIRSTKKAMAGAEDQERVFGNVNWVKVLCVVFALALYGFILERLGFVLSTALFMAFLLQAIEAKKWYMVVFVSVFTALLTYALFELWLQARLPRGILGI